MMLEEKQPTVPTHDEGDEDDVSLCTKVSKHVGGIICIIIMVVDWVAYAEIMQTFKDGSYNHLYFIRYCCVCGYMMAIIPWFFVHRYSIKKIRHEELKKKLHENLNPTNGSIGPAVFESYSSLPDKSVNINKDTDNGNTVRIIDSNLQQDYEQPVLKFMKNMSGGIAWVGTIAFFVGYIWFLSLDYTFVAANNTIYQSQCVFVLIFSVLILKTKITLMKMVAMLLAVGGVAMVSFGTTKESNNNVETTWFGYVECLISTILYALQTVSLKYYGDKYFRHNLEMADDFLFMTGMGIFVFVCLWPGLIILDVTGIETFSLPQTYEDVMTIILPMFLDGIFIGSYMTGITLSGPILMSLGALSVIPCSFMVDIWLHGLEVTIFAIIGSLLIFVSFVVIEIPTHKLIPCIKHRTQSS